MRRTLLLLSAVALALLLIGGLANAADGDCQPSGSDVVCTFGYTGAAQSWTVPEGVTQATFDVYGAEGYTGIGNGGLGGRVRATLSVTSGDAYRILVGGERGFNGGGAPGDGTIDPPGGLGGGASDVRTGAFGLADRLLVAGGGGGGGVQFFEAPGGDGGHPNGGAGAPQGAGGGGGTQTAGGVGAFGAGNGSPGQGGDGADSLDRGGGGGGGGYYGGGGGGEGPTNGGGGGGSSYAALAATDVIYETGVRERNGLVTITYAAPNQAPVANDDTATTDEDEAVGIDVLANDSDPEGDGLRIVEVSPPSHGTASIDDNGTPADPADDLVAYAPDADYNGPDSFTYKAGDGPLQSEEATVSVTVTPVNDAPTVAVAAGGDCKPLGGRAAGTINLTVADAESESGDLTLTATSSNGDVVPEEAISFGGSGAARTLSVRPTFSDTRGGSTLTVEVGDGEDTGSVRIGVLVGTRERDGIIGGADPDVIFPGNGGDLVSGRAGNDLICGAPGDDDLRGNSGDDTLRAATGDDTLAGGEGTDFFVGGPGTDEATDFDPSQGDKRSFIP